MSITSQKIVDIAQKTKVPCLQGSVSVSTAMEIMDMYEINIVAVVCENDFAGVFSRIDFNRNLTRHNLSPEDTTLYEVMTINVPCAEHDASVKETYEMMLANQCEFMPVLNGRELCGIVSIHDLGKDVIHSFEKVQMENEMIMRYIQTGEAYGIADYN